MAGSERNRAARGPGTGSLARPCTEVLARPYTRSMSSFQDVVLLEPRAVPLGGPRGMTVHRTLPARRTSLVGAELALEGAPIAETARERGGLDPADEQFGPCAAHTPAALPAPTPPHGRLRSRGRVGHPAP